MNKLLELIELGAQLRVGDNVMSFDSGVYHVWSEIWYSDGGCGGINVEDLYTGPDVDEAISAFVPESEKWRLDE